MFEGVSDWDYFEDGLGTVASLAWQARVKQRPMKVVKIVNKRPPLAKKPVVVNTPPIVAPGTNPTPVYVKQSIWDKLLEHDKFKIQTAADIEKAKVAAGIAPGTQPTAAQQAAMVQELQNSNSVGSQTGGALDGALAWVGDNILVVGGVVLLVTLLFLKPPGRK